MKIQHNVENVYVRHKQNIITYVRTWGTTSLFVYCVVIWICSRNEILLIILLGRIIWMYLWILLWCSRMIVRIIYAMYYNMHVLWYNVTCPCLHLDDVQMSWVRVTPYVFLDCTRVMCIIIMCMYFNEMYIGICLYMWWIMRKGNISTNLHPYLQWGHDNFVYVKINLSV